MNSEGTSQKRSGKRIHNPRLGFYSWSTSWTNRGGSEPPNPSVAETVDEVVVDHADCLHVGVNDGRADEAEPTAF
jgi:hypothetical protein